MGEVSVIGFRCYMTTFIAFGLFSGLFSECIPKGSNPTVDRMSSQRAEKEIPIKI